MAAQKFTKKSLKQDSFITYTERALEYLQRNATAVGVGLLVVVVLLVGGWILIGSVWGVDLSAALAALGHGRTKRLRPSSNSNRASPASVKSPSAL